MKTSLLAMTLALLWGQSVLGQNPSIRRAGPRNVAPHAASPGAEALGPNARIAGRSEPTIGLGDITPTPSMWLYQQQMQQRQDPKEAIRRRAEFRAMQRDYRLAAQKWYGFSKTRPRVSHTPFTDDYSPSWVGNGAHPHHWRAAPAPAVIVEEAPSYESPGY